jgi:hypothetical protein
MIALYLLIALLGGVALGVAFHAWITKEKAATKAELQGWANRLRITLSSDLAAARTQVTKVAEELEAKL